MKKVFVKFIFVTPSAVTSLVCSAFASKNLRRTLFWKKGKKTKKKKKKKFFFFFSPPKVLKNFFFLPKGGPKKNINVKSESILKLK